jgi:hypothetical protein
MRRTVLSLALALLGAAVLSSAGADAPAPPQVKTVYLYGETSLEELRTTNPQHYARAKKIIAAAPELCRYEGAGGVIPVSEARDVNCLRTFIKTSLPPKWELHFRLDDVRYIALVTVKGLNPKLTPAH